MIHEASAPAEAALCFVLGLDCGRGRSVGFVRTAVLEFWNVKQTLNAPGERPVEGEVGLGSPERGAAEVLELLIEKEVEGGEGPEGEQRRAVALRLCTGTGAG